MLHHLGQESGVLVHLVLDVNLLVGITREGESGVSNDSLVNVRLDLLSATMNRQLRAQSKGRDEDEPVEVLLRAMTRTKVVERGADVDSLRLLPRALLDEGAEGGSSRSETSHDDGRGVDGRKLCEET